MRKFVTICLALIVMFTAKLHAQESDAPMRLSPDQAVDLAIKSNLGLEASRSSLETKRRASRYSWNQFIPNITVAGIFNMDNEARSISGMAQVPWDDRFAAIPGMSQNNFEMQIPGVGTFYNYVMPYSMEAPRWQFIGNIQVSLNISAAMFENMRRLRFDYETGVMGYDKAKRQLERDIRKMYHSILLLRENIELMQGSFANVERQVQMAQANYNAGLAPELTLLQARVARENMRPIIDQVENGYKLSMAQFAMFLGMDYDTQFELIPLSNNTGAISNDFVQLDVTEMISRAAASKPDVQELRHTITMLESARRMQIMTLTPVLSLGWSNSSVNMLWKKDTRPANIDPWTNSGSLSITFSLRLHSLIPWSADFQGIKNLDDQIRTLNTNLAQMVVGTEIEVYNTVLSLERTRLNTQAQLETVRLAEQAYRLTEQAYRAGLQNYIEVQSSQQSLHQARVQLLEQQFNYLNGLIDLEYAIGVPFGTLSSSETPSAKENQQ